MPLKSAAEWVDAIAWAGGFKPDYQRWLKEVRAIQADAVRWGAEQQRKAMMVRFAGSTSAADALLRLQETPLVTLPKERKK